MKILLVDDHAIFRAGLIHLLHKLNESVEVIQAGTCAEMREAMEKHIDLGLVLLDLRMPDGDGLTAFTTLKERCATLPMVVLSASDKREDIQRCINAGALGFISKTSTPEVMLGALHLVMAGGIYVPPNMVQQPADDASSVNVRGASAFCLTPRQLDVLARVTIGKTNKAIANELGLTEATVKAHITAVFRALRVNNRTQAARAVETNKLKLPNMSFI